jgi:hypothetical protein
VDSRLHSMGSQGTSRRLPIHREVSLRCDPQSLPWMTKDRLDAAQSVCVARPRWPQRRSPALRCGEHSRPVRRQDTAQAPLPLRRQGNALDHAAASDREQPRARSAAMTLRSLKERRRTAALLFVVPMQPAVLSVFSLALQPATSRAGIRCPRAKLGCGSPQATTPLASTPTGHSHAALTQSGVGSCCAWMRWDPQRCLRWYGRVKTMRRMKCQRVLR